MQLSYLNYEVHFYFKNFFRFLLNLNFFRFKQIHFNYFVLHIFNNDMHKND